APPPRRVTVSCRGGRGGLIGPGMLPVDRELPDDWREPDLVAPRAPDLEERPGRVVERDPHAYLAPHRAGQFATGPGGADVPVVADLETAVARETTEMPRVAMLGSGRAPFARLTTGVARGLSLSAADPAST